MWSLALDAMLRFPNMEWSRFLELVWIYAVRFSRLLLGVLGVNSDRLIKALRNSVPYQRHDFPIDEFGLLGLGRQNFARFLDHGVGIVAFPHFRHLPSNLVPSSALKSVPVEVVPLSPHGTISKSTFPQLGTVTVPVGRFGRNKSQAKVVLSGTSTKLDNLFKNRFHHFKLDLSAGDYLQAEDASIIVGEPVPDVEELRTISGPSRALARREDVTIIFVDGLASEFFNHVPMHELMPHTAEFFSGGQSYSNFRSCAEWTLPSVASFFSGREPLLHGIWHPNQQKGFSYDNLLLSEAFDKAGYFTSMVGGNRRVAPGYGYARGFDRVLFKYSASVDWSISRHIELQDAFKQRSHFSWISVMEIHPPWPSAVPPLAVQKNIPAEFLAHKSVGHKAKSPYESDSDVKLASYLVALQNLDSKLERLYDRILRREASRRQTVVLLSDHGQSYFPGGASSVLSDYRTRVPLLVRDPSLKARQITRPVQSSDLARLLLNLVGAPESDLGDSEINFGGIQKGFTLSESIYPGRHYLCRIHTESDYAEFASRTLVGRDGKLSSSGLIPMDSTSSEIGTLGSVENFKQYLEERIERSGITMTKA